MTDAIHTLTNFAATAHCQGDVTLSLFLDVKCAFPSVIIPRLLHDMCLLGIPQEYTVWLQEKLTHRSTMISFDDYESPPLAITNGIDQGCPLSVILYLIYNSGLLHVAMDTTKELAVGFMDDITLVARAPSFPEAAQIITDMMYRSNGALKWSTTHCSVFEHDKAALLGTTRRRQPDPISPSRTIQLPRPTIQIEGHTIEPSATVKYLGVIIDEELQFNDHTTYTLAKGTKWILQVR